LILDRATAVISKFPFPRAPKTTEISLFIIGHGTEQDPASRNAVQAQCELIQKRGLYAQVEPLFLEEKPLVNELFELAQKKHVVVVPFFISDGLHVQEDIPVMLGEPERIVKRRLEQKQSPWRNPTERKDKLIWYAPSVGSDPKMPDVILARVKESLSFQKP
jgi:sirohydrochlorin cobaltochelatase